MVDKLQLRDWLFALLEVNKIPGLAWVDKDKKIFAISWRHGRKKGWTCDTDCKLFKEWAVYKKRYRPGDDGRNAKLWKSRFRCALNALNDIQEIKTLSNTKGENAKKCYQFLQKTEVNNIKKSRIRKFGRKDPCDYNNGTFVQENLEIEKSCVNSTQHDIVKPSFHGHAYTDSMYSCWPYMKGSEEQEWFLYGTLQDSAFKNTVEVERPEHCRNDWKNSYFYGEVHLPANDEFYKSSRMVCTLDADDLEANKTIEDFLTPKAKIPS